MERRILIHLCIAALATLVFGSFALGGCADQPEEPIQSDSLDASFLDAGKADSAIQEGSPEAIGVLRVVNESTRATLDKKVKLDKRAVDEIVALRAGPDQQLGTGDDLAFGSLAQLDAVPYVGPTAFEKLRAYAKAHGFIPKPATLRGTVRTSDGTPITGGTVWVGHADAAGAFDSSVVFGDVDGSGRYSMTLLSGTYDIAIHAKTDGAEIVVRVATKRVISGTKTQDATIPVITVHGRVMNDAGEPVAGVVLGGYGKTDTHWASLNAVSGADGRFAMSVLPAVYEDCAFFRYGAPAGSPYVRSPLGTIDFTRDAERAAWTVVRGAVVHGNVHYSNGTPASGVVWIRHERTSPTASGTLDADGGFEVVVEAGTYNVDVVAETVGAHFSIRAAADRVIAGDVLQDVTIPVVTFEGRVVDEAGTPVGGVTLGGFLEVGQDSCGLMALSDAEGRFSVPVLPGVYQDCGLDPLDGTPYSVTSLGTLDLTHDQIKELVVRR